MGPQPGTSKRRVRQHLRGPILDPFFGETCLENHLGPAKSRSRVFFFRLWRRPRALQEPIKRLSDAFSVDATFWTPFWTPFWQRKGGLGPQKSSKSYVLCATFVILPFSAPLAFGPRFGPLFGTLLGAFWPPRWLKPVLELVLDRPRVDQEHFLSAPDGSKSAPRGQKEGSKKGSNK